MFNLYTYYAYKENKSLTLFENIQLRKNIRKKRKKLKIVV